LRLGVHLRDVFFLSSNSGENRQHAGVSIQMVARDLSAREEADQGRRPQVG
jgi:hypothetical protein